MQLIVGIPGDSYDRWKTWSTNLMDWGLHDNYQVFNYALLPNAPAADKAFAELMEIVTILGTSPRKEPANGKMTPMR